MSARKKEAGLYAVKGLPTKAGTYYVCLSNKQTAQYEWKEVEFSPDCYNPIWEKAICWSYN